MTNPNYRVLIFSILRFISTKCCKTQIFKWTQPSNKQFKAASKHVDEIRTIYDCGKIKMNPNDRLLLVSLNKKLF